MKMKRRRSMVDKVLPLSYLNYWRWWRPICLIRFEISKKEQWKSNVLIFHEIYIYGVKGSGWLCLVNFMKFLAILQFVFSHHWSGNTYKFGKKIDDESSNVLQWNIGTKKKNVGNLEILKAITYSTLDQQCCQHWSINRFFFVEKVDDNLMLKNWKNCWRSDIEKSIT